VVKESLNESKTFVALKYPLPTLNIHEWNPSLIHNELPNLAIYNWMWRVSESKFHKYSHLLTDHELVAIDTARAYRDGNTELTNLTIDWCRTVSSTHVIETFFYYAAQNEISGFLETFNDHPDIANETEIEYEEYYNFLIEELYIHEGIE